MNTPSPPLPTSPEPPQPPLLTYPESWDILATCLYASLAAGVLAGLGYASFKLWQRRRQPPAAISARRCHQRIMAMEATRIPQIHGQVKLLLGVLFGGDPTTLTEDQWPTWLSEHHHALGPELAGQLAEHLTTSHRLIYAEQTPERCYKTATLELTANLIAHANPQPQKV